MGNKQKMGVKYMVDASKNGLRPGQRGKGIDGVTRGLTRR